MYLVTIKHPRGITIRFVWSGVVTAEDEAFSARTSKQTFHSKCSQIFSMILPFVKYWLIKPPFIWMQDEWWLLCFSIYFLRWRAFQFHNFSLFACFLVWRFIRLSASLFTGNIAFLYRIQGWFFAILMQRLQNAFVLNNNVLSKF